MSSALPERGYPGLVGGCVAEAATPAQREGENPEEVLDYFAGPILET